MNFCKLPLKNRTSILVTALFLCFICTTCRKPKSKKSVTPAAVKSHLDKIGTASLLITVEGGYRFVFGDITRKYMCHSIRKPFLGALFGIATEQGQVDIDATMGDLGINDFPDPLTAAERQAAIKQLLLSRSGIYHPAAGETQSMSESRPKRGSHPPGTFFYCNNWDFNALGTVSRNLTGKDIFQAFDDEIAEPIGMEDFSPRDGTYSYEYDKSQHPAYFFRMSTRDMARFGQLYLSRGKWSGTEVVPEVWVYESTHAEPLPTQKGDPYGYLWRIIPPDDPIGPGGYHAGLGVHALIVLPERQMVIVHRVDTDRPFSITWAEIKKGIAMAVKLVELEAGH